MAFDFEKIAHVGGASSAPRVYAYETTDERTVVLGTDNATISIYGMNLTFVEL